MGLKDLIVTPIYLIMFSVIAYFIRPYVTNARTRKYFLPALWVRFAGAILLGVLYQYYYGGGDTFNYWVHGSRWIYSAFQDDFSLGIKLLLEGGGKWNPDIFKYTSNIWYYRDPASYAIVKLTAVFDLFTLQTYSATAVFFAVFSFSGLWAMYSTLQKRNPESTFRFVVAILFIPSVVFWGSGILKDSITLGALAWMTWALIRWFEHGKKSVLEIIIFAISFWFVFRVKLYILICFLPMIAIWLFFKYMKRIRNLTLRLLLIPSLLFIFIASAYFTLFQITKDSSKYRLDTIAERARITAYDIRYGWGARTGGDGGYDIGLPDGTLGGMIGLMPAAVNVSLFRPYLWEVRNPLMLLAALESLIVLTLTIRVVIKNKFKKIFEDPFKIFCLSFVLLFAFGVGISTFNFGTLFRYKIPIMPFLLIVLFSQFETNEGHKK